LISMILQAQTIQISENKLEKVKYVSNLVVKVKEIFTFTFIIKVNYIIVFQLIFQRIFVTRKTLSIDFAH